MSTSYAFFSAFTTLLAFALVQTVTSEWTVVLGGVALLLVHLLYWVRQVSRTVGSGNKRSRTRIYHEPVNERIIDLTDRSQRW